MATTFPTYPATTFEQAVELSIFASNQLHNVINGDATTTIETENGDIPSVRKALVDNFFFKTPIRWVSGETSTVFNQLYYFYDDEVVNGWYYAPSATTENPVSLGSTPVGDDNWILYTPVSRSTPAEVYPWYVEISQQQTSVSPPYTFDTAIVVYNGVVLTATKDYTITDSVINFTSPLEVEVDAEYPDILFCYLGKVEEGDPETNYLTYVNLAKNTGATLVGTPLGISLDTYIKNQYCETVSDLRLLQPNVDNQVVILKKSVSGGPTINAVMTYDATDTTSPDDGVSCFVTTTGARWKSDISNGFDVRLAGLLIDGSNLSSAMNTTINAIVSNIVSNNRANNIVRTVKVHPVNFINEFTLTSTVNIPSIINVDFIGSPYINSPSTVPIAFKVANDSFPTLTETMFKAETSWNNGPLNQVIGNRCISCSDGGRITLRGPGFDGITGFDNIKTYGVVLGNTVSTTLDVRDCSVEDINIIGFYHGVHWGSYYTFMVGINNFNISRCFIGVYQPETTVNSGERYFMNDGTVGNITSHGFSFNGGATFTLIDVSCDFTGGDAFHFGPNAAVNVNHLSGHLEGIQGYFGAKETPTNYSKSKLYISESVLIDPRYGSSDYRGIRQYFSCPYVGTYSRSLYVYFDANVPSLESAVPKTAYPTFMGAPGVTGVYIKRRSQRNPGPRYLTSYDTVCTPRINANISITAGQTVGSNIIDASGPTFAAIITGGATVVGGSSTDADSDGYIPFKVTLSSTTDIVDLYSTARGKAPTPYTPLWFTCSIKIADAAGSVLVMPIMSSYIGTTVTSTYNSTTQTVISTSTPIQRAVTTASGAINVSTLVSSSGLSTTDYQAITPASVLGYWQGNDFFVPGMRITGFTGTIYIKLPTWWYETENGEY